TQSLHTNGFDEALALPTERAARIALRTQQILAHESGAADTIDPFAGSYVVEALTDEIEERAQELIDKVEELGGSVQAIPFIRAEVEESAWGYEERYRIKQDIVVGVNEYVTEDIEPVETLRVDPESEREQVERLKAFKEDCDHDGVAKRLDELREVARGEGNLSSRDQLRALDQAFQNARPTHDPPVLIMTDQEGGLVKRVDGPPHRSPAQIGQIDSKKVARSTGHATGRNLRDVGVNVNLAPVVDVARRGSEMERLGRAYSEDKDVVTAMAGAFARGMAERHVAATAKHFPGLGAAQLDEDRNMNVISYTTSQLRHIDEVPYKSLATKRVPLVMVSTAEYPAFASGPALFSHRIATRELRRYIKFNG